MPDPLNGLRDTDIIRLELVQANSNKNGTRLEAPHEDFAPERDAVLGKVIDDD